MNGHQPSKKKKRITTSVSPWQIDKWKKNDCDEYSSQNVLNRLIFFKCIHYAKSTSYISVFHYCILIIVNRYRLIISVFTYKQTQTNFINKNSNNQCPQIIKNSTTKSFSSFQSLVQLNILTQKNLCYSHTVSMFLKENEKNGFKQLRTKLKKEHLCLAIAI